jgi:hypothetical protein
MALPAFMVCGLWARSYWASDRIMWRADDGVWGIRSARGALVVAMDVYKRSGQPAADYGFFYDRLDPEPASNEFGGMFALNVNSGDTFEHDHRAGFTWFRWAAVGGGTSIARLVLPLWSLVLVTALPAAAAAVRRLVKRYRRRRRLLAGRCTDCGYDLRGSAGRCPECGAIPGVAPEKPDKEFNAPPARADAVTLSRSAGGVGRGGTG